ncbi:hypothetical protein STEG23_023721 [Scotinomys teguina]
MRTRPRQTAACNDGPALRKESSRLQRCLPNVLPNRMITLSPSNQMLMKKGSAMLMPVIRAAAGDRVDVCGSCCHQKPCGVRDPCCCQQLMCKEVETLKASETIPSVPRKK